jgi:hypothetical protein
VCCALESLAGGDPVGDVSKTVWVKRVGARWSVSWPCSADHSVEDGVCAPRAYGTQRRGVRTVCRFCAEAFVWSEKEEALLANADEEATLL